MTNIICTYVESEERPKDDICIHPTFECMHRLDGKCCWVPFGSTTTFSEMRGVPQSKLTSIAKKKAQHIKSLIIIDRYYEFLKEVYNIYPKRDSAVVHYDFPFNYPRHYWTDELLRCAICENNIQEFCIKLECTQSVNIFKSTMNSFIKTFCNR